MVGLKKWVDESGSVLNDGLICVWIHDWVSHREIVEMAETCPWFELSLELGFWRCILSPDSVPSVSWHLWNEWHESTLFYDHDGICLAMGQDKWSLPTSSEYFEAMSQNPLFLLSIYHSDGKVTNQVMSPAGHRLPVTGHPYTMNAFVKLSGSFNKGFWTELFN